MVKARKVVPGYKVTQSCVIQIHQYLVVGRCQPEHFKVKEGQAATAPKIYKMRIYAEDVVHAKSKFWYYLRKLNKVKKAHGEVLSTNEVHMIYNKLDFPKRSHYRKNFWNCLHL